MQTLQAQLICARLIEQTYNIFFINSLITLVCSFSYSFTIHYSKLFRKSLCKKQELTGGGMVVPWSEGSSMFDPFTQSIQVSVGKVLNPKLAIKYNTLLLTTPEFSKKKREMRETASLIFPKPTQPASSRSSPRQFVVVLAASSPISLHSHPEYNLILN